MAYGLKASSCDPFPHLNAFENDPQATGPRAIYISIHWYTHKNNFVEVRVLKMA